MLKVKNIYKNFENFEVLKDLNFTVSPSEICVFLGVIGAGKSTTMKILAGILKPTKGEIIINNINKYFMIYFIYITINLMYLVKSITIYLAK